MTALSPELDVAVAAMAAEKDYETAENRAMRADYGGVEFLVDS